MANPIKQSIEEVFVEISADLPIIHNSPIEDVTYDGVLITLNTGSKHLDVIKETLETGNTMIRTVVDQFYYSNSGGYWERKSNSRLLAEGIYEPKHLKEIRTTNKVYVKPNPFYPAQSNIPVLLTEDIDEVKNKVEVLDETDPENPVSFSPPKYQYTTFKAGCDSAYKFFKDINRPFQLGSIKARYGNVGEEFIPSGL